MKKLDEIPKNYAAIIMGVMGIDYYGWMIFGAVLSADIL